MVKHPDTAIYTAFDDYQPRDTAQSERNLIRAVLLLAMDDIKKTGEVQRDARRFFASNNIVYPYSFLNICFSLNLCPRTIRTIIGLDREPISESAEKNNVADEGQLAA